MILVDAIKYELWNPHTEDDFEKMVKEHVQEIFGQESIYIDRKQKLKKAGGRLSALAPGNRSPKNKRRRIVHPFIESYSILLYPKGFYQARFAHLHGHHFSRYASYLVVSCHCRTRFVPYVVS